MQLCGIFGVSRIISELERDPRMFGYFSKTLDDPGRRVYSYPVQWDFKLFLVL